MPSRIQSNASDEVFHLSVEQIVYQKVHLELLELLLCLLSVKNRSILGHTFGGIRL